MSVFPRSDGFPMWQAEAGEGRAVVLRGRDSWMSDSRKQCGQDCGRAKEVGQPKKWYRKGRDVA